MTRRAWSVFSPATTRGACTGSSVSFRPGTSTWSSWSPRPTKRELGEYCFIIDFEGHVADEVVADCLRDLHAGLRKLKFLGSYPAAGAHGPGPAPRRRSGLAGGRPLDRRGAGPYSGDAGPVDDRLGVASD